ncbi:MAG: hypothetical protein DI626_03840 [Micavibrio aeruginosavorus]|uniref:Uncharacterized protein n=1 Tax=Micavibrio aeruginosavorus TaxID=349221 RepID=A0A2W5A2H9_9BACT|nr:MAG: hypothetical protein DI626_03840 [Micavibrio aeruginosavorus]
MTDQPQQKQPPRPRQASQQPRRRPPPKQESRLLGYIVLGIGVAAVLAVAILAIRGRPEDGRTINAQTSQELQADLKPIEEPPKPTQPATTAPPPRPSAPVSQDKLYFKRQPSLSDQAILGTWQAGIGRFTAILQLQAGTYQIILAEPALPKRIYSVGTYTKLEDLLVFTPRLDWADPSARGGAPVPYEILTRAPFPMMAAIVQGRMLWQNPPQSEERVLVPYKMPLTMGEDVDYIVWLKLN